MEVVIHQRELFQIRVVFGRLRIAFSDAIKPVIKEHGATEGQIEAARVKMHRLNSDMGLYK